MVVLGVLSMAGVGIGTAAMTGLPYMGMHYGGCQAQGGGMMGQSYGQCGQSHANCYTDGRMNTACDPDQDGTCDMTAGAANCPAYTGEGGADPPCH